MTDPEKIKIAKEKIQALNDSQEEIFAQLIKDITLTHKWEADHVFDYVYNNFTTHHMGMYLRGTLPDPKKLTHNGVGEGDSGLDNL